MKGSSSIFFKLLLLRQAWLLRRGVWLAMLWLPIGMGCAARPTSFDGDDSSGYAIFRSGRMNASELRALCDQGVAELVVMDGSAQDYECQMRDEVCPGLKVRYNHSQDVRQPVTKGFLIAFDSWIEESRQDGRKIAFRCRHGWHRAGRLAAYYRIRFQGWREDQAVGEMLEKGDWMDRYPQLQPQALAMAELTTSGGCSQVEEYCPRESPPATEGMLDLQGRAVFVSDICSSDDGSQSSR